MLNNFNYEFDTDLEIKAIKKDLEGFKCLDCKKIIKKVLSRMSGDFLKLKKNLQISPKIKIILKKNVIIYLSNLRKGLKKNKNKKD